MKLVIFTAQVSPYHNARYIGAAQYFDDVHVVSVVNAGAFPEFLARSVGEYTLHKLYQGREDYTKAIASRELVKSVNDTLVGLQPDVIAAAGWTAPESLAALAYGRDANVPVIVMSESQIDDAPRSILREFLKQRIVSQFDAALVGGPPHAEYATDLGIPRDKVHFGYNAVDNAYFEHKVGVARADIDASRSKYVLPEHYMLASARFIKKKNLPNLISAYGDARRRLRELPDLVILGDGPERGAIEDAIQENHVGGMVHLPGFRGYEVLPAYYGLAEAFLHVSTAEQWGLVINEAMASGAPVIASQPCGAARTLIRDGVSGVLTGVDVGSISDALVRLFTMTHEQRTRIGAAGTVAVRDWGPARFGSGMLAAVESALKAPRRGRIAPWDQAILAWLQKRTIEAVS